MINIFVTIGTTDFSHLIAFCDKLGKNPKFKIVCQIANVKYTPEDIEFFRFTKNIEHYYLESDVIISHAGAGTVYRILEMGKKLIVVPNPGLKDSHQIDICKYLEENNLAFVANNVSETEDLLNKITAHSFSKYKNSGVELVKFIASIIS